MSESDSSCWAQRKCALSWTGEFRVDQQMGIYLQFYNLKVDEKTHKNNLSVDIKVSQGDQVVAHEVKTGAELQQNGEQVTFEKVLAPKLLPPGKYKLEIQATDLTDNQTVSRSADFTVTPAVMNTNVAANGAAGR